MKFYFMLQPYNNNINMNMTGEPVNTASHFNNGMTYDQLQRNTKVAVEMRKLQGSKFTIAG